MKLDHIALWTKQIEVMVDFYEKYFDGKADEMYVDEEENISCCYIIFTEGSKLELIQGPDIYEREHKITDRVLGYTHLAFDVGSKEKVDEITEKIEKDGYQVEKRPAFIVEWFYESAIIDPEGNIIEINCELRE